MSGLKGMIGIVPIRFNTLLVPEKFDSGLVRPVQVMSDRSNLGSAPGSIFGFVAFS